MACVEFAPPERGPEEAVEDFNVGEGLALGGAALGDFAIFGMDESRCDGDGQPGEQEKRRTPPQGFKSLT